MIRSATYGVKRSFLGKRRPRLWWFCRLVESGAAGSCRVACGDAALFRLALCAVVNHSRHPAFLS